jgi:hypothetical protein
MFLWILGSAFDVNGGDMDVDGQTEPRLVINCIWVWNLASASDEDQKLWIFIAELNQDLLSIGFACRIWVVPLAGPEELGTIVAD